MHEVDRGEGDEEHPEPDEDQRGRVLAAATQLVPGWGQG